MTTQNTQLTKEQFLEFRAKFKEQANAKSLSASDMILYNLIRGKDPKSGFTPITNPNKLSNGAIAWFAYEKANYIGMLDTMLLNLVMMQQKLLQGDT